MQRIHVFDFQVKHLLTSEERMVEFFELLWNNLLEIPSRLLNTAQAIGNDFWNPNLGFLENLYYNEALWFGAALIVIFRNGGQGCLYVILTFPILWFLGHAAIVSLGIEVFFIILAVTIAFVYLKNRRQ